MPYETIKMPYKAIKGHKRPYKAIQGHTRPYKTILDHIIMVVKSNDKTLRGRIRAHKAIQIQDHTRPHKAIQGKSDNSIP